MKYLFFFVVCLLCCGSAFAIEKNDPMAISHEAAAKVGLSYYCMPGEDGTWVKCVNGEIASNEEYTAEKQRIADNTKDIDIALPEIDQAVYKALLYWINDTRARAGLAPVTLKQFKTSTEEQYKAEE